MKQENTIMNGRRESNVEVAGKDCWKDCAEPSLDGPPPARGRGHNKTTYPERSGRDFAYALRAGGVCKRR